MSKFIYTNEILAKIIKDYEDGIDIATISETYDVPARSLIAKLSSLGVYKKKEYLNKRGEKPVKKEEIIYNISQLLQIDLVLLDSMEKVTKTALTLIESRVRDLVDLP